MVASVLTVLVHDGTAVADGDTLVMLESMKMEIPVLAETAGTIRTVAVAAGDTVRRGDLIAVLD